MLALYTVTTNRNKMYSYQASRVFVKHIIIFMPLHIFMLRGSRNREEKASVAHLLSAKQWDSIHLNSPHKKKIEFHESIKHHIKINPQERMKRRLKNKAFGLCYIKTQFTSKTTHLKASLSSSSLSPSRIFFDIICKNSLNSIIPLSFWSTSLTMLRSSVSIQGQNVR